MKYRFCYDYLFVPSTNILIENKIITGLSIYVKFNVYLNGKELFFTSEDDMLFAIDSCHKKYLHNLIHCIYNKESMFEFLPTPMLKYAENRGYMISYEIASYYWNVEVNDGFSQTELISKKQFEDVFRNNIDSFDNSDNYPAQTLSYYAE